MAGGSEVRLLLLRNLSSELHAGLTVVKRHQTDDETHT